MEELYDKIIEIEEEMKELEEDKLVTRREQIIVNNRVLNKEMKIKDLNGQLNDLKYKFEKEKVLKLMDYTVPIFNLILSIIYALVVGINTILSGIIIANVAKSVFLMYMVTLGMGVLGGTYIAYRIKDNKRVYNFLLNKYPEFNVMLENIKKMGEEIKSDNISLERIVNNQNKINSKMEDFDNSIDTKQVSLEMLYDRIKNEIISSNLTNRDRKLEKVLVKKKVR